MESVNVDSSKFLPTGVKLRESCSDSILLKMLEEGLLADITLIANGGSVKAHRSVLASVSPVFCAMFQHDMKEKLTSEVNFFEMSINALRLFLLLLYTTNDEDTRPKTIMQSYFNDAVDKYFADIFDAALKYQVGRRLGCVLRSALLRNLKPENCWYYLFCCSMEVEESKSNGAYEQSWYQTCSNYILENYVKVVESESFLREMGLNPKLVYSMILAETRGKSDTSIKTSMPPRTSWQR